MNRRSLMIKGSAAVTAVAASLTSLRRSIAADEGDLKKKARTSDTADIVEADGLTLHEKLEEYGFIIVPKLISDDKAARVAERLKELMNRQPDAGRPDLHLGGVFNHLDPAADELFEPLMMHPIALDLARRVLGEGFQMTEVGARWKKPGAPGNAFHVSGPVDFFERSGLRIPDARFVIAFSWILNDMTHDNGGRLFVPGSHNFRREPKRGVKYEHGVSVEAPNGSLLMFHGAIWHAYKANVTRDQDRLELSSGYMAPWLDATAIQWQLMKRSVRDRLHERIRKMNRRVIED